MNKNDHLLQSVKEFLEQEEELFGEFTFIGLPEQPVSEDKAEEPVSEKPTLPSGNSSPATENSTVNEPGKPEYDQHAPVESKLLNCTTLDELKALCEVSEELKTDLKGTNLVFGVGNPHADLMLIGEAPGEQEDIQGEPFVGAAGQLLNKILAAIQFNREDVYIANILKHRPPGNRNPNPDERMRSLPYLLRQIDIIQPKLILCLGKVSGTTLLKKETTLKSLRGQFYPFRNAELTVTYHPAALLRNPHWKRPAWEDVQQVRKRYDELGCKP